MLSCDTDCIAEPVLISGRLSVNVILEYTLVPPVLSRGHVWVYLLLASSSSQQPIWHKLVFTLCRVYICCLVPVC